MSDEISVKDRGILRGLAGKVAGLAARPCEAEKRELWYRHNVLEPTCPLVFCDPEGGWREIIRPDDLECEGSLARGWELHLRREVFWGESMGDDRVVEPCFNVHYVRTETDWGVKVGKIGGENLGAYRYDSPIKDFDDLAKLRVPTITVDYDGTQERLELAREVMGDLLRVRLKGSWLWSVGMTWTLIALRGLEQIMYDAYDQPEMLHRLMTILRDAIADRLDFLEANGLFSLNNDGTYVGSGGFGYTRELPRNGFDGKKVRTCDMWGFAESQETGHWSPELFEEFILPYQLSLLERFGLNCYGCCEPLDRRWNVIEKIPRLRRVSISPWSDLAGMAEKLGDRYIFSMKPNPAHLAVAKLDEEFVRKELRTALEITRDCRVEVIMKDCHTIGGNPENAMRWSRIAREESERVGASSG